MLEVLLRSFYSKGYTANLNRESLGVKKVNTTETKKYSLKDETGEVIDGRNGIE